MPEPSSTVPIGVLARARCGACCCTRVWFMMKPPAHRITPLSARTNWSLPSLRTTRPTTRLPASTISATARASKRTRSEEHTSELQSLMRISYTVFSLKNNNKKQKSQQLTYITHQHTTNHIHNSKQTNKKH